MPTFFKQTAFWGVKNLEKFGDYLRGLVHQHSDGLDGCHASDQLITFGRNLTFMWDEDFYQSFLVHAKTETDQATMWRKAVHYWAARHCLNLQGDFVECGVWLGTTVKITCDAINFKASGKCYWLYDVFDYHEGDLHQQLEGHNLGLYDQVKKRFADLPEVKIIKGYIPDSFLQGLPERVSLLHIDMNNAQAEIAALEALWEKVVPGGMVLLDDFGWLTYQNQTIAELEFFKTRGYYVLELPTGQGLVCKR